MRGVGRSRCTRSYPYAYKPRKEIVSNRPTENILEKNDFKNHILQKVTNNENAQIKRNLIPWVFRVAYATNLNPDVLGSPPRVLYTSGLLRGTQKSNIKWMEKKNKCKRLFYIHLSHLLCKYSQLLSNLTMNNLLMLNLNCLSYWLALLTYLPVSYTHLTLPSNREV